MSRIRSEFILYITLILALGQSILEEVLATDYAHNVFSPYLFSEVAIMVVLLLWELKSRWVMVVVALITSFEAILFFYEGHIRTDDLMMIIIFLLRSYVFLDLVRIKQPGALVQQLKDNDSYISCCMKYTREGVFPVALFAEPDRCREIVAIAKRYVNDDVEKFALNMEEPHYFIPLWTAHLILEFGGPEASLRARCLEEIRAYSESSLNALLLSRREGG